LTPVASTSLALVLCSSFVKSRVSSGSTSLRRKSLPLLIRNGSASSLAFLMISFVFIGFSLLVSGGRQKIERCGEHQVNHNCQHTDEPGGTPSAGHQRGSQCCEQNHCHCPGPQIQIHRSGPDEITEQDQNRTNKEGYLRGAPQCNSHAKIETVL